MNPTFEWYLEMTGIITASIGTAIWIWVWIQEWREGRKK